MRAPLQFRLGSTLLFLSVFAGNSALSETLSLPQYIDQVDGKNQNVTSAKQTTSGAVLSVGEADLMFRPNLFAQAEWDNNDFRNAMYPAAYRSYFMDTYQVGVKEMTPWGFNLTASYILDQQGYLGADAAFVTGTNTPGTVDRRFWEGTPKIEATFSLWRNWMGGENHATESVIRSTQLMNQYNASYQTKSIHAEAENAYVRLVSAQQLIKVYEDSLTNANDILRWNDRRMKVNLGEESDLLQAQANVESSKLLLQQSQDDFRVAARDFNRLRNTDSDSVNDELVLPSIENTDVPPRNEVRDDVRAAQENAKLTAAQAKLGEERNRPTLEAYGSFALNNRDQDLSPTFNGSLALGQQTSVFGLRFNMPLDFNTRSDTVRGYHLQRDGAETLVVQKIFEQEVQWKDLTQQLSEAKRRYDIAVALAKIQKKKVDNERVRLKRGRTTTYQTLIFNIDFNTAEAARIQAQATVLNLVARLRTFGDSRI